MIFEKRSPSIRVIGSERYHQSTLWVDSEEARTRLSTVTISAEITVRSTQTRK